MDLADHEWANERGSRTSQISNQMNRDGIDIVVDPMEASMRNSTRWRSRRRLDWGEAILARGGPLRVFEGAETSCEFDLSERATTTVTRISEHGLAF